MKAIKRSTIYCIIYELDGKPGAFHRKDGPAIEHSNGDKEWYINGKLHREDGPALEYNNGDKEWFINGRPHRDGGPAIDHFKGKEWWVKGKRHREDGPAIEWDNKNYWFINDELLPCETQEEFEKLMKLKAFW